MWCYCVLLLFKIFVEGTVPQWVRTGDDHKNVHGPESSMPTPDFPLKQCLTRQEKKALSKSGRLREPQPRRPFAVNDRSLRAPGPGMRPYHTCRRAAVVPQVGGGLSPPKHPTTPCSARTPELGCDAPTIDMAYTLLPHRRLGQRVTMPFNKRTSSC